QSSSQSRVFNVAEYIDEILTSIHHVIKQQQITIKVSCDPDLTINGCPGSFSQIISNLVLNASIHAFPNKEGAIDINVTQANNQLSLMIIDDGNGIKPENLSKIFEPFYTTNRDNGGSGLGLNIVYNIVTNQLHGTINCASEINQGTVFSISFPVEIA
ncbi:MAG: sensor histidine kinase, partial [Psychrobium sp.]